MPERTPEEIVAHIREIEVQPFEDFLGVRRSRLIEALPYEHAVKFADVKYPKEEWVTSTDHKAQAIEYMPFAIGKALGHRGLSAERSIDHFKGLVWLMGDEEYGSIDWDNYAQYGVPILRQVADLIGFDWPSDNEELNNMAQGHLCTPDCEAGCA